MAGVAGVEHVEGITINNYFVLTLSYFKGIKDKMAILLVFELSFRIDEEWQLPVLVDHLSHIQNVHLRAFNPDFVMSTLLLLASTLLSYGSQCFGH